MGLRAVQLWDRQGLAAAAFWSGARCSEALVAPRSGCCPGESWSATLHEEHGSLAAHIECQSYPAAPRSAHNDGRHCSPVAGLELSVSARSNWCPLPNCSRSSSPGSPLANSARCSTTPSPSSTGLPDRHCATASPRPWDWRGSSERAEGKTVGLTECWVEPRSLVLQTPAGL